jgi:hypothetical protein
MPLEIKYKVIKQSDFSSPSLKSEANKTFEEEDDSLFKNDSPVDNFNFGEDGELFRER